MASLPYARTYHRFPLFYPVIFGGTPFVGEGMLTNLSLMPDTAAPELRLALGNLGPGDYVIELAQQFIAFRVVR